MIATPADPRWWAYALLMSLPCGLLAAWFFYLLDVPYPWWVSWGMGFAYPVVQLFEEDF